MNLIVARSKDFVIGLDGSLPWEIKDDLRWFKSLTRGKTLIMGRKTFESIGKPLKGRLNLVLSSKANELNQTNKYTNLKFYSSKETLLKDITNPKEVFVIGGSNIYSDFISLVDKVYISEVQTTLGGGTLWRYNLNINQWSLQSEEVVSESEVNQYSFIKKIYLRKHNLR